MRPVLVLALIALSACAQFPQVDAAAPASVGVRPALLTQDQLKTLAAQTTTGQQTTDAPADDLQARATGLRSR